MDKREFFIRLWMLLERYIYMKCRLSTFLDDGIDLICPVLLHIWRATGVWNKTLLFVFLIAYKKEPTAMIFKSNQRFCN